LLNLFDFLLGKQFQIVLWSLMVGDWKSKGGSEKIKRRLLRKMKAGDVILLHDSGDTLGADLDAPSYTIKALEDVFREVHLRGLTCVRIDEMIRLEKQEEIESQVDWKKQSFTHYG
jgi:peptidoglycan/xylan/chitin deacetylase (PgdA/CDA1 family)